MGKFINRLNDMFSEVTYDLPLFTTVYENGIKRGELTYENKVLHGTNKPIRQDVMVLLSANMNSIIELINENTPLSDGDIDELRNDIMSHSLQKVRECKLTLPSYDFDFIKLK